MYILNYIYLCRTQLQLQPLQQKQLQPILHNQQPPQQQQQKQQQHRSLSQLIVKQHQQQQRHQQQQQQQQPNHSHKTAKTVADAINLTEQHFSYVCWLRKSCY